MSEAPRAVLLLWQLKATIPLAAALPVDSTTLSRTSPFCRTLSEKRLPAEPVRHSAR